MQLTIRSNGGLARLLAARVAKWNAVGSIAAHITIPPALQWVLWQEYGVAGHGIDPVESNQLAFPYNGATEIRGHVAWPGIHAHHTVGKAVNTVEGDAFRVVVQSFAEGGVDDPELVKSATIEAATNVKAAITAGLADDLPGRRDVNETYPKQSGKLLGSTAAVVFDEQAQVTSE